jgi:hypothetical protein
MADASVCSQNAVTACSGVKLRPLEGLFLAILAGAIAWGIVQAVHPVYRVDKKFDVPSIGRPPEEFAAHRREQDRVDQKNAMLYLGGLGLLVGATLGLREATRRRSWLPLLAAPLGALGGAVGGPLGSQVFEYVRAHVGQADLAHTVEAQLLVGVPMGLGVGLGLGLATRTVGGAAKATLAGVAAGVLAAVIYPIAISIFFPAASTDALIPDELVSRLLWLAVLSGAIGLIVPIAGSRRKPRAQPATSAA